MGRGIPTGDQKRGSSLASPSDPWMPHSTAQPRQHRREVFTGFTTGAGRTADRQSCGLKRMATGHAHRNRR